jgi:glycosyltransferase involved in cell wall biosynthesis
VTAFLFFFDLSSYIARKNPFQVIEAFKALVARHPREPAHLILKFKGSLAQDTTGAQLRDAVGAISDQVQLIEGALPDHVVKNLVRNADCFISLHRSEGFGRGLAEAMALEVPVIATGYSGNLTFMRPENSRLVACRQVAVGPGEYPHWEDQSWAQPELEDAVAAMEDILLSRTRVLEKARQARLDMAMNFSSLAMGTRYAERLREVMAPA